MKNTESYELIEDGHNEWRVKKTHVRYKLGIFPIQTVEYLNCIWYRGSERSFEREPLYVQIQCGDWGGFGTRFEKREHAVLALEQKLEADANWEDRERKRNTVLTVVPVDVVEQEKADA